MQFIKTKILAAVSTGTVFHRKQRGWGLIVTQGIMHSLNGSKENPL
jgi:hypothetical protein